MDTYIDLDRSFCELSKNSESDNVTLRRAYGRGKIRWPDLTKEHRLIILSEAGSGKTTEIRNVTRNLRLDGKAAFFLRLEFICKYFDLAFVEGTYEEFEGWLKSDKPGWLLLDSVDEARLRSHKDFEWAILKLKKEIGSAIDRTHITLTSRTAAWLPKTDLDLCTKFLPSADGSSQAAPNTQNDTGFKIVTLEDLTRDQVEVFVSKKGVEDSKAFRDAVERKGAWAFTERPQDLEALTEFWLDKGEIGSRTENIENSINRRLIERDEERGSQCPLKPERTRPGARLLAAATTLSQKQTIAVLHGGSTAKGSQLKRYLPIGNLKNCQHCSRGPYLTRRYTARYAFTTARCGNI